MPYVYGDVQLTGSNVAFNSTGQHMTKKGTPVKIEVPTYDGSGQGVHPSILYFPLKWNGWNYWMAFTPYPNGNDDYENPSIVVSNDGVSWVVPNGLTNPIVPPPADVATGGFNSDPFLLYDRNNNKLIMYYRRYVKASNTADVLQLTSADGVVWTSPVLCTFNADTQNAALQPTSTSVSYISPSFVRINGTIWYCFFTEGNRLYRARSTDGLTFTHPQEVTHNLPITSNLWHLDVKYTDTGYHAVVACFHILDTNGDNKLYYGYSADGIKWAFDRVPVLSPDVKSSWYSRQIYKSCIVPNPSGDGVRVYISTQTLDAKWYIGYFDAATAHFTPKLDIPLIKTLVAWNDNIQIAAGGSLLVQILLPFSKKIGVALRNTTSLNFSVDIEYQADYHAGSAIMAQKVIPSGAARVWDGVVVDPIGQYGFLRIYNHDATNPLTIHTFQVTLFPDE